MGEPAIPTGPSTLSMLRDWLVLFAAVASATFAGLIWWLARKRLDTRYELDVEGLHGHGDLRLNAVIRNRGDKTVVVEAISVESPLGIVIGENGGHMGASSAKPYHETAQKVPYQLRVKPDESIGTSLAVRRPDGFKSLKSVSIRLHILRTFPTIRHKKKTLTAILPARIREAQT